MHMELMTVSREIFHVWMCCCSIITYRLEQSFFLLLRCLDNKARRISFAHLIVHSVVHTRTHTWIQHAESKFVGWISSFVSFCHLTASGGRYLAKFKCTHLSSGIDFVSFPLRNASIWHGKHSKEEQQQLENLPITSSS